MFAPILLYFVIILTYIVIRPPLSYNADGSMKPFGIGKGHTLFPIWIVAVLTAVIVSFLYAYITV